MRSKDASSQCRARQSQTAHISAFQFSSGSSARVWYRHHPLFGTDVCIVRRANRVGPQHVLIMLPDESHCAIPTWMLDEAFCNGLVDAAEPCIAVAALHRLRMLIDEQ